MKRGILSLILALLMLAGTAIIATANTPGNTGGSIEFRTGSVIIKPPGDCYCCPDCCPEDYGDSQGPCTCPTVPDPRCPCPCVCTDKDDYDTFFRDYRVAKNLYFGQHALTVFGRFDSANRPGSPQDNEERYTTGIGEYTGVEVINQTTGTTYIKVSISDFKVGSDVTLGGFELRLMQEAAILRDDSPQGGTEILPGPAFGGGEGFILQANEAAQSILTVESAREVKAAWYGLLDIEPGISRQVGTAQAILTWTASVAP